MKKRQFELFCILFTLYVYTNYIVEDWSIYTKLGKFYYYPFWFIRSILVWVFCPIFLPEYFFKQSKLYKEIKRAQNSPEYQAKMIKSMSMFKF